MISENIYIDFKNPLFREFMESYAKRHSHIPHGKAHIKVLKYSRVDGYSTNKLYQESRFQKHSIY